MINLHSSLKCQLKNLQPFIPAVFHNKLNNFYSKYFYIYANSYTDWKKV